MRCKHVEIEMLENKVKLSRKQYNIVALGILIVKIDIEKREETKEKIVIQNTSMYARMKMNSIFSLIRLKKNSSISSSVVEAMNAKITNTLIQEKLTLDHFLHGCMRYYLACIMKQCFNRYQYHHNSFQCRKTL